MPDARTESSSPTPATGPAQDPAARARRPRRRGRKPSSSTAPVVQATDEPSLAEVSTRLDGLMAYDREQLGRRLERVRSTKEARKRAQALQGVIASVEQA